MAQAIWTRLPQRGVVEIGGAEAAHFLQNLVTNDIDAIADGGSGYGALLSPQGKVQFDFIIFRDGTQFLFDLPRERIAAFVARLTFYRLRSSVEIVDRSDERDIVAARGDASIPASFRLAAPDPRLSSLGIRAIAERGVEVGDAPPGDAASHHHHRIALGVPEGGVDFTYEEAFPHDANIDQLGGIAFAKGCYIGQEVVSRMEHRGTARRRVVMVRGDGPLVRGAKLTAADQAIGTIGSVADKIGLALVRTDRAGRAFAANAPIIADGNEVTLTIPEWANFNWPVAGSSPDS